MRLLTARGLPPPGQAVGYSLPVDERIGGLAVAEGGSLGRVRRGRPVPGVRSRALVPLLPAAGRRAAAIENRLP